MSRIIIHAAKKPEEVRCGDKSILLCRCGLSKNQPYCDTSHKKTADEKDDALYLYNENGERAGRLRKSDLKNIRSIE